MFQIWIYVVLDACQAHLMDRPSGHDTFFRLRIALAHCVISMQHTSQILKTCPNLETKFQMQHFMYRNTE